MGFHDDIAYVANAARKNARPCCSRRPTRKASRNWPSSFLRNPQEVKLLEQHEQQDPPALLRSQTRRTPAGRRQLLKHYRPVSTLAFCNTKQQCRDLLECAAHEGFHALTLNGDLEQRERDQVLIQFANRSVLSAGRHRCRRARPGHRATRSGDQRRCDARPGDHIHRIGRTGRADEDGWALSLCSPPTGAVSTPALRPAMNCASDLGRYRHPEGRERQAAGSAHVHAADPAAPSAAAKEKIPPRRHSRRARPEEAGLVHPRAGRQDHRHRAIQLCGRRP
jgi:ATP-independent RNA helicase DbpA